jgi:hypothetical protein
MESNFNKTVWIFPVVARDLYKAFQTSSNFNSWIRRCIRSYGLDEGWDFMIEDRWCPKKRRIVKDYELQFDFAQKIASEMIGDMKKLAFEHLEGLERYALKENWLIHKGVSTPPISSMGGDTDNLKRFMSTH